MWFSLKFRLVALLTFILLLAFGAMMVFNVKVHTRQLTRQARQSSEMLSLTIEKSLQTVMLENRRDDLTAIVSAVGELPKMEGISIVDNRGKVYYSTSGSAHDLTAARNWKPSRNPVSHEISGSLYRTINTIENRPPCMRCHGSSSPTLGYLVIDRSIADIHRDRDHDRRQILLLGIFTVVAIIVATQLALSRLVHHPVSSLVSTMARVGKGDETARADERGRDEFAGLAKTFNKMLTDLETKNKEIVEAHDRLSQAERLASVGLLAAGVAHQIGNPLATISISAEALGETPDAGQNRFTRAIVSACNSISVIISELLNFDRLRMIDLRETPVAKLIEEAISACGPLMKPKHLLETDFGSNDISLRCDERQFHRVLANIISNALQAMPDGGKLSVIVRDSREHIRIEVADTGPGIPDNLLPHIFEPFCTTKEVDEGSGLGLAIAREIVRRHEGEIGAYNKPEGGAVVWVQLPSIPNGDKQ